eukprot:COSAG01_NODE_3398_length_6144_cov_24.119438_5_plen_171_part_00
MHAGLFQVCDSVYQVRGLDLANMTIVEGNTGLIVTDVLTTAEVAAGALELYYQHRPRRPVRAVIYSHSHVDHFGGALGVISADDAAAGTVHVIAPKNFNDAIFGEIRVWMEIMAPHRCGNKQGFQSSVITCILFSVTRTWVQSAVMMGCVARLSRTCLHLVNAQCAQART